MTSPTAEPLVLGNSPVPPGSSGSPSDTAGDECPNVFEFSDYREYLKRYYAFRKRSGPYSFAMFSKRAGLASPNYLKLVMDGERNLTDRNIRLFAKALNLGAPESRYFENLVRYCQAESPSIRSHYFEALSELSGRNQLNVFEIQREHYEMLSKWYVLPIAELARCRDFREDGTWISKKLGRAVTPGEATSAIAQLEKHGMLVRDADGRLKPGGTAIRCESMVADLAFRQFHQSMLGRVLEAIENEPVERRNLRSLTLAIREKDFPVIVNQLREFVSQLNTGYSQKGEQEGDLESLCQISIQTILLSQPPAPALAVRKKGASA